MFTGLITALGTIQSLSGYRFQIQVQSGKIAAILADLALGDSIAVDGICLTVTEVLPKGFTATASPETLNRTTLGQLTGTAQVNLEPSLRVGSKLGGHFVTGHVDGQGYLEQATQTADAWEMRFGVPDRRVARYIIPKGSIAVNGVSLTVADCEPSGGWFTVAVIPVTYGETNLQHLVPGQPVNLEGDVLGKYVEKFLGLAHGYGSADLAIAHSSSQPWVPDSPAPEPGLTSAFLAEHGYD